MDEQIPEIKKLQQRVDFLEETNRSTYDALDLAVTLTQIQLDQHPREIISKTKEHLKRLIPFDILAFMLVNENDFNFEFIHCDPLDTKTILQQEIDQRCLTRSNFSSNNDKTFVLVQCVLQMHVCIVMGLTHEQVVRIRSDVKRLFL